MLNQTVQQVKGIGEKFAEDLAKMSIYTVKDLLEYFPTRYNVHELKPLRELVHEDQVMIMGRVVTEPMVTFYGRRKSRLVFMIEVEKVSIKAVMFNRAFAKKQMNIGDILTLTGKWDAHRLQITVNQYQKGAQENRTDIQPIYSSKGNVTTTRIKNIIQQAIKQYLHEIEEFLPNHFLKAYKIPPRKDAIYTIHKPNSKISLKHARRRFMYEEFLLFQLKIQLLRKIKREAQMGNAQHYMPMKIQEFINQFSFTLTKAQQRSLNEILSDMKSMYRMNRLLQGDVGSGKTAVAAICLYASVTADKQGALMVPTEILAEQHFQSLEEMLGERAKVVLLTGSVKGKKREKIISAIEAHEVNIVVGTHALIQDDVFFNDLGLVVVDEQHRFGVEQRRKLREKGLHPDVLFMTATPIPRTLAITTFGDMDVSVIDEMPKGRKEIETYWVKENTFERVLKFIQKRILHGEQAYVICPLIEESDKLDIQNAVDLYDQLRQFYPPEINVGLMHGRLTSEEKEQLMKEFAHNNIHVLVSTTVVEVGVNVPNATVMVIYDAQRFGLSQLHQLRGRVGRGEKKSYCILIADAKGEVSKERMKIMTETNDGFELSEADLKLRGAGDFFGHKQSGLPDFKIGDVVRDYRALETARKDAQEIIDMNLLETDSDYYLLKRKLESEPFLQENLD